MSTQLAVTVVACMSMIAIVCVILGYVIGLREGWNKGYRAGYDKRGEFAGLGYGNFKQ